MRFITVTNHKRQSGVQWFEKIVWLLKFRGFFLLEMMARKWKMGQEFVNCDNDKLAYFFFELSLS